MIRLTLMLHLIFYKKLVIIKFITEKIKFLILLPIMTSKLEEIIYRPVQKIDTANKVN